MNGTLFRSALALGLILTPLAAQDPPAQSDVQQVLPPEQLESLVAPIALYPDSLLSQVLVASTYPLELVEAAQWLQQNPGLTGTDLADAAKQQNWDPSVQALVPFGDVIKRLNSDIRWTTDLGNAFLAQQADVMAAVQRLRARAKDSGKLTDTQQQKVVTENQDGQTAIEIQPADPQVIYVPVYNPAFFWDPYPLWPWPPLFYPGIGIGWQWGFGINLGFYFGGCCGWGGWGWGPGWFNHSIIVNNHFFHRYNFREFHGSEFHANSAWVHNPEHRGAVPYPRSVAPRFQEQANRARMQPGRISGPATGARANPGLRSLSQPNQPRANNHSAFGGVASGSRARVQSDHGYSSLGSSRSAPVFRGGGSSGGSRPSGGFGGGRPAGGGAPRGRGR